MFHGLSHINWVSYFFLVWVDSNGWLHKIFRDRYKKVIWGRKNIFCHPSNVKSKTLAAEKLRIMGNYFTGPQNLGFCGIWRILKTIEVSWPHGTFHGHYIREITWRENYFSAADRNFIGISLFPMLTENNVKGERSNASECIGTQLIRC